MKIWKLIAAALVLSTNVNAAIVDLGSITRDTLTGIDWLDVTETRGMSYNDVTAQMGTGGALEGWRYATTTELDQLIHHLGFSALSTPNAGYCSLLDIEFCAGGVAALNGVYYEALLKHAIDLLGDTRAANEAEFTDPYGHVGSTWGVSGYGGIDGILADQYAGDQLYARIHYQTDQLFTAFNITSVNGRDESGGSFLVQGGLSTVPVPAAVWLFGSGLIGLIGFAKRKTRA